MTINFKEKHEQLIKEENDLKEKLQIETSKVKENLDNYLSKTNDLIKINEKINNGIKNLENEEKNLIKTLNYISQINKSKKELKNYFKELMKNLKIIYDKENNIVNYEEYYFNGIPIPKDIDFKKINSNSINLQWNIDEYNFINIDKNKIIFKVEIREKNINNEFMNVYEGYDSNCLIENLSEKKDYEIRICSFYNDLIEAWSPIQNIKIDINFELKSNIIKDNSTINFVFKYIRKKFSIKNNIKSKLIYRASSDGPTPKIYHEKCDGIPNTLCLIKTKENLIFGGYINIKIICNSKGENRDDKDAFVFSIDLIKIYLPKKNMPSIHCNPKYGPIFGNNINYNYPIIINGSNFFQNCGGTCECKNNAYEGFQNDYEINGGNPKFHIDEIEVFQLIFNN